LGSFDPATGKFVNGITRKYTPTNWADEAFGTGYRSEANVLFNGGNEKLEYDSERNILIQK
jgi:hypothetical protein